jgi:hypothetical protein
MSAARETMFCGQAQNLHPSATLRTEVVVSRTIEKHTARPDVDELVKALEEAIAFIDPSGRQPRPRRSAMTQKLRSALTRHRDRAQNGGGL